MTNSCKTHCCSRHGCKYGDNMCPVVRGIVIQEQECEYCWHELDEFPFVAPLYCNKCGSSKLKFDFDITNPVSPQVIKKCLGCDAIVKTTHMNTFFEMMDKKFHY